MLDFGLMTEVTPTQRIALFEYIAHLTTQVSCQHRVDCASVSCRCGRAATVVPQGGNSGMQWGCVVRPSHMMGFAVVCAVSAKKRVAPQSTQPRPLRLCPQACLTISLCTVSLQDWDKVAYDLQRLGFVPEDVGDEVLQEMAGPLGSILVQLSGGGGATKLNIDAGKSVCCRCGNQCVGGLECEATVWDTCS